MDWKKSWVWKLASTAMMFGLLVLIGAPQAEAEDNLSEHLEPFRAYLDKTWTSDAPGSTEEKPKSNITRWERALNGQAIRIVHSIADGEYGGETMVVWDQEREKVVYYYFTTAGFYTTGTFEFDGKDYVAREKVTGDAQGVTEVKEVGKLLDDNRLHTKAYYFKNGEWEEGHEFFFTETPEANILFR